MGGSKRLVRELLTKSYENRYLKLWISRELSSKSYVALLKEFATTLVIKALPWLNERLRGLQPHSLQLLLSLWISLRVRTLIIFPATRLKMSVSFILVFIFIFTNAT